MMPDDWRSLWGSWKNTVSDRLLSKEICDWLWDRCASWDVLEYGSGFSTLLMRARGAYVYTIDSPAWQLMIHNNAKDLHGTFDFALIDCGPTFETRREAIATAWPRCHTMLVDDYEHRDVQKICDSFEDSPHPGYYLLRTRVGRGIYYERL